MSNNFVREGNLSGDAVLDGVAQKVFFESVKIGTGSPSAAPSPASKVWLYADRSQNPAIMWLWDPSTATWHITGDGTGTGAVDSVNGQTGIVVLDHTDVGAEEAGAAADLAATLATVATSGDYDDLINKPTIPDISSLVEDTDPRLSDARTPLTHTHPVAQVSASAIAPGSGVNMLTVDTSGVIGSQAVPTPRLYHPLISTELRVANPFNASTTKGKHDVAPGGYRRITPGCWITGVDFWVETATSTGTTLSVAVYDSDPMTGVPTDRIHLSSGIAITTSRKFATFTGVQMAGPFIWVFFLLSQADSTVRFGGYNTGSYPYTTEETQYSEPGSGSNIRNVFAIPDTLPSSSPTLSWSIGPEYAITFGFNFKGTP